MDDREWRKQELEAMERLALSGADRARWDSLDAKGLMPSRMARKLAGLKHLASRKDPFADYEVEAAPAFRAPFDVPADESAEAAPEMPAAEEPRGSLLQRRRRRDKPRLFRR
jgi:hypothetical protein